MNPRFVMLSKRRRRSRIPALGNALGMDTSEVMNSERVREFNLVRATAVGNPFRVAMHLR